LTPPTFPALLETYTPYIKNLASKAAFKYQFHLHLDADDFEQSARETLWTIYPRIDWSLLPKQINGWIRRKIYYGTINAIRRQDQLRNSQLRRFGTKIEFYELDNLSEQPQLTDYMIDMLELPCKINRAKKKRDRRLAVLFCQGHPRCEIPALLVKEGFKRITQTRVSQVLAGMGVG
jgi:DNA-directed RNA polymerase specialized sigma24 family protein